MSPNRIWLRFVTQRCDWFVYWNTNHLDADTETGLDGLLAAMARSGGQASVAADLVQDLREQQLAVLRGTYPAWDIALAHDRTGKLWWTAVPSRSLTIELMAEGAARMVRREDAIALAAALAWQSTLMGNVEHAVRTLRIRPASSFQGLRA